RLPGDAGLLIRTDGELHEGVVGDAPIDRERGDAGARDHREGEKPGPDDFAQRLEAADALAYAFEPTVRAYGFQRHDERAHRTNDALMRGGFPPGVKL